MVSGGFIYFALLCFSHVVELELSIDIKRRDRTRLVGKRILCFLFVSIEYEKLSLFWNFCNIVCHSLEHSKKKGQQVNQKNSFSRHLTFSGNQVPVAGEKKKHVDVDETGCGNIRIGPRLVCQKSLEKSDVPGNVRHTTPTRYGK